MGLLKNVKEIHLRYPLIIMIGMLVPIIANYKYYTVETFSVEYFLYVVPKSILITAMFWEGDLYLVRRIRKRLPNYNHTAKRLLIQILVVTLYTFALSVSICVVFRSLLAGISLSWNDLLLSTWDNMYISLLILTLYECAYFFSQWKSTIVEAEKLKRKQLASQFETLKNQVSPHFLFNSLNSLMAIIPEDSTLAVQFTRHLSDVYRYVLQNKDREVVTLAEEMDFVKAYFFLHKIRFGENIHLNTDVAKNYLDMHVAPLSLQMLIENAIKHNIISKEKPLFVDIYVEGSQRIVVKNNLQVRKNKPDSSRVGLQNIITRYKLLAKEQVQVLSNPQSFMVSIPLLSIGNYESTYR